MTRKTLFRFIWLIAAAAMVPGIAGCSGSRATRTGFLADYEGFAEVASQKNILLKKQPSTSLAGYRKVIIEPVAFALAGQEDSIPETERKVLAHCFEQALTTSLSGKYRPTHSPGAGTLRIRSAITAVDPSNPALNLLTTLALLLPLDSGGVSLELAVLDSVTGRPLADMIAWDRGSPLQFKENFHRYGHARFVLCQKALQVREILDLLDADPASISS